MLATSEEHVASTTVPATSEEHVVSTNAPATSEEHVASTTVTATGLLCAITQKIELFITTEVRT
jgi:hypothetical protein